MDSLGFFCIDGNTGDACLRPFDNGFCYILLSEQSTNEFLEKGNLVDNLCFSSNLCRNRLFFLDYVAGAPNS